MDIMDRLNQRLRELMAESGIKAAPLARKANLNESAVRDILRGRSKNPGIVTLQRIANVLGLRPSDLYEEPQTWPIIGEVRHEDVVTRSPNSVPAQEVESPFLRHMSEKYAAIRVNTDFLRPYAHSGDFLVVDTEHENTPELAISQFCLCKSEDENDPARVRMLRMGETSDTYHLVSVNMNAVPDMNKRISQAAPVVFVLPKDFAQTSVPPTHAGTQTLQEEQTPFSKD
ncbi:MAG: helix-turn-helix transcriptional regulator [Pseudomonadota bacterium]